MLVSQFYPEFMKPNGKYLPIYWLIVHCYCFLKKRKTLKVLDGGGEATVKKNKSREVGSNVQRIVATGDKAWAASSGILSSDFVEHDDIEALDEIEEENAISNGNDEILGIQYEPIEHMQQKRKSTDAGSSHFKSEKKNL
ncbi:hypothetical protein V6N12_009947 [Hibiscus sabdariffa]|uniref:Uncharacterized protein n=1 Tax=Hibiscus sabdariffa TaxID=183260 RepID=A0ABR2EC78_9ROSI